MAQGYLALMLHAHLPFVRHPEYDEFLEEDWLFEAITETYLPLLQVFEGLKRDGVFFRMTMSLTPTLCAMLNDELLRGRYVRYLDRLIELSRKEIQRTRYDRPFHELAQFYHHRLAKCRELYVQEYERDLVGAFRGFQDAGFLEIATCAATHAYLPLFAEFPQAVRAQIMAARDDYRANFGRDPRGIWLPECAYFPGLDRFVQEAEIRWFVLDTHGLMFGEPRPQSTVYAPVATAAGPAAFGRDHESSKQVWSAQEGYPGDVNYRDFFRDIGFDAEYDYIRSYIQSNGQRKFTGIKYYRITGKTRDKEPYLPNAAREVAAVHAGHFLYCREKQVEYLAQNMGQPPIVLAPYDAELFGHWWFEGPEFLNFLLRKAAYDQGTFETITPSEYLDRWPRMQVVRPAASSWGNKGFGEVWLEGSNAWIYPHLHHSTGRMIRLAQRFKQAEGLTDRAMQQLARELMLAQASDWAFIMKTGTMVEYAARRTKNHVLRFNRLADQVEAGTIDERFLENCEWRDNLFPHLHWRHYL